MGRWKIIGAVIAIVIALVLAARGMRPQDAPTAAAPNSDIPLVSILRPGLSPVTSTISFTGAIYARWDMPIGADGDGGRVTAVLVEAGDRVKKGQVLARLDDTVLRPQLERLKASLTESRANAALALAQYKRAKGVEAAGALSAEEIERRRAMSVTADAQVDVAAAAVAEAEARLTRTSVRSPADGIVLTRSAEVGQMANVGAITPLFRLAAAGEVEMRGMVAEQDLPALRIDQAAQVHLTGSGKTFAGKVRLLGAVIDPQTRLGEIRVSLQPDPALRPGAFARAEVVSGSSKRPVLPQSAVLSDDRGSFVYVVNAKDAIERRPIVVASVLPQGIVVESGLDGAERVVATAGSFLREGEKVTTSESSATRGAERS